MVKNGTKKEKSPKLDRVLRLKNLLDSTEMMINDLWDYGIFDDHNDPFCLTSAYLVAALHELHSKDHKLDDEMVMAAYQILQESGIEVDGEDFPLENPFVVVECVRNEELKAE